MHFALSVIEEDTAAARPNAPPRKMVTDGLRKSLTKQVQNLHSWTILDFIFTLMLSGLPHRWYSQRCQALSVRSPFAPEVAKTRLFSFLH